MEDSDSKRNESVDLEHNEETRLLRELQALISCSVPTDLLMSILQSQMLSHSNHDIHQSISHLLISYSGKRGTIANTTILPLDIAQIIRYLFGVSIAIINCTTHTTLKDLLTKLPVHSKVNYKEWTKQLKSKMIANQNKNSNKNIDNNHEDNDEDKDAKKSTPKAESKENDDNNEIASQILILSDNLPSTSLNPRNTLSIVHPQRADTIEHEESHSSLFADHQYIAYHNNRRLLSETNADKPSLKKYLTEPYQNSRNSTPSATPPPYALNDDKEREQLQLQNPLSPPFGYGIHEEHAISSKYHKHHYARNREHLSQSIHSLHKMQHSQSNPSAERDSSNYLNTAMMNNASSNGGNPANKASSSKHKMDVISCQVLLFHNIHKLSKAMQSIVIQIMKMKSVPSAEHAAHVKAAPSHQLCICTRQYNKSIPYLLRDLCFIEHVIASKNCLKKLHKFVKYDSIEYKQNYYSHVSGISFDGFSIANDNKLNTLTVNLNQYNVLQSKSPTEIGGASSLSTNSKMKDNVMITSFNDINITGYNHGLFPVARLRALYLLVNKVFIHNSIAQYIRDIIVAIRLHPDVKQGCSSFRANEALQISSKFITFMSILSERYKRLRNSQNNVDQLIARMHFVRPKDIDMMAIQILSHRIDTIANAYTPSPSNTPLVSHSIRHHRFLNKKLRFSAAGNMAYHRSKERNEEQIDLEHEDDDDNEEEKYIKQQNGKKNKTFTIHTKAEILKQLRLNSSASGRRRSGAYHTGSMSVPRTPRLRRSVSYSAAGIDSVSAKQGMFHQRSLEHKASHNKQYANGNRRRLRSRSRTIGDRYDNNNNNNNNNIIKEEKMNNEDIDIEDFEFEVFSDSDDYDYDVDDDEYELDADQDEEYGDNDGGMHNNEYMDNEHMNDEYVDDYDEYMMDDNMNDVDYQKFCKRNSNRERNSNYSNDPQYVLLNDINEKKLSVEQRLVYNLLRRVLLPPK